MAYNQQNIPVKVNCDKAAAALAEDEAFYLLNHEVKVATNKGTLSDSNPIVANYPAGEIVQPVGENYSIGSLDDRISNKTYDWVFNSNGAHYIKRISAKGGLEIVYDKGHMNLSADPRHSIERFRAMVRYDHISNCGNRSGEQLIWTDGLNPIGCLDVEASIATDGFTTSFFDICPDPSAMVQFCVPEPCLPIVAEFIPRTLEELGLSNKLINLPFKFRYRHVYYDLRASEWSEVSKPYYLEDQGCFQDGDILPRCLRLRIPMGNPMVEKIEIAFSNGTLADDGENEIWMLHTTIEKYKKYNSSQQRWYERELAEDIASTFDPDSCTFEYIFCNDKECLIIDTKETSRVFNPYPRKPQCLIPFNDNQIGFINYEQGSCPVDKIELEKIKIINDCVDADDCQTEMATITVRAIIVEVRNHTNEWVYRNGGVMGGDDDETDRAWYGGAVNGVRRAISMPLKNPCDQYILDARNFTVYIEGMDYFVEMKQYVADNGFTTNVEWGIVSGMSNVDYASRKIPWEKTFNGFFYQEAKFKVPKGTSGIIRMKAPDVRGNDDSTSARIYGTVNVKDFRSTDTGTNWQSIIDWGIYELEFDTCNGDVVFDDAFLIPSVNGYDNVFNPLDDPDDKTEILYKGYITDANNQPVADARVYDGSVGITKADHNGFYFLFSDQETKSLDFKVEKDCGAFQTIEAITANGAPSTSSTYDIKISDIDYTNKMYHKLQVGIKDCNGNFIKGITIAVTQSKAAVTDAISGLAVFKIRNDSYRNKTVKAYMVDKSGCFIYDCNGNCNTCLPKSSIVSLGACFATTPTTNVILTGVNIEKLRGGLRGLKRGGRYPFAIVLEGDCGYRSAAYQILYLDIPKAQSTKSLTPCQLSFDATGFNAPSWATCMKIARGSNINNYELQWIVDKIEKTADGKIKLTIQSLNDYNTFYFNKTNTIYQWLKGDRVEFIRDGSGVIIDANQHGILNYLTISPFHDTLISGRTDADANYFNQLLIEDDGRLDFLQAGAIIEIQRAKECTTEPVYYTVASIPVIDGKLANETGTFETFDTYIKRRVINNGPLQTFEHHSPSDFWGTKLTDAGKKAVENIYENERRFGRNVTINAVGQFNYFGDLVKTIPAYLHGDIVAAWVTDNRALLMISEKDNDISLIADDLLRVGSDSVIRANSPEAIIADPDTKIGQFGCRYGDIGSIHFDDGKAGWFDGNVGQYIIHDYQTAREVSKNQTQTYFKTILRRMDAANRTSVELDKIRFCTGKNEDTGVVYLTNKSLRHPGINNDKRLLDSPNTTIAIDFENNEFLTWASITPDRYSNVKMEDEFGCSFLTYLNGIPYIHPLVPEKFNEFFGVPVDRVIGIALNKYPEKQKIPLAIEVQGDMMYFIQKVETSDPNFDSEIPPVKMKRFGNKFNGPFLRNKNSRGGLYGGKEASDYAIKVTLVRDNTDGLKYGTIDNVKRVKFDSLSMILFRFQFSEQSGFPETK